MIDETSNRRREQAYQRIAQRRRRQAARKRRRRIFSLSALALLVLCTGLFLLPDGKSDPLSTPNEPTPNLSTPNASAPEENFDDVDITPAFGDSEQVLALKELAADYPRVKKILRNLSLYPEDLLELVLKNAETVDYVADYPEKSALHPAIDLSAEAAARQIPLLLQWDERWGYEEYGSGLIGWTGCGPTCMTMLILYLTGDDSWNPATVARWAEDNGYYASGSGTAWTFMGEGCAHFGLRSEELPLVRQYMINALNEGRPIVCAMSEGDFTTGGHYIILTDYDAEQGFTVNDPNSPIRSAQYWPYERIESQISNLWAFSKA